jgi:hypothetical protein
MQFLLLVGVILFVIVALPLISSLIAAFYEEFYL